MDGLLLSAELGLWTQMCLAVFSDRSAERLVLVASDLISEPPFTAFSSGQFRQAILELPSAALAQPVYTALQ